MIKKIIISLFGIFMLTATLFPPYAWVWGDKVGKKSYEFLFSNNVTDSAAVFFDTPKDFYPVQRVVIIQELLLEYFLIIIFWVAVYLLFRKPKKASET
jgi:hypothetical protein